MANQLSCFIQLDTRTIEMLAPLAIIALLIGGGQTVIALSADDTAVNDYPQVAQTETVQNVTTAD